MNAELQRFVRHALARGLSREAIRQELAAAGWRPDEVEGALGAWQESGFPVPVPRRRPALEAREAFLYLVLFATLYTTAFNTGQVLFALIERWLPDPVRAVRGWQGHGEWVRGATAALLIAFPVFLFVSRVIGGEVAREPGKRGSPIRRWLTYLTLFIAALVIIGDLTVLVTRLLGGELAPRFLLKVAVVLLIAATVFAHYLGDLRREEQERQVVRGGLLARLAAAAVFLVTIAGLVGSGSPRVERGRQLDEQRIMALQNISGAIQSYHGMRRRLPDSLGDLLRMPNGPAAETLRDPATARPIVYRTIDSLTYELCVEFQTADREGSPAAFGSEFWRHGAGEKCFRFEVGASTR
jgi:hypothetical protein